MGGTAWSPGAEAPGMVSGASTGLVGVGIPAVSATAALPGFSCLTLAFPFFPVVEAGVGWGAWA